MATMKILGGWLAACVAAMSGGCDEAFTGGGVTTATPLYATITARDLRGLADGEALTIALDGAYPTVFEFDGRDGPIDFSRLEITTPDEEAPVPMRRWFARQVAAHGVDLEGLPSERFRLANDRSAGVGKLPERTGVPTEPVFRGCAAIEVVELDAVVAVMFVDDAGC